MPNDAPTGWMWIPDATMPGGGHFRPDVRHPKHPYNVVQRRTPKLRSWLDEDEDLQAFIRTWKPRAEAGLADIRLRVVTGHPDPGVRADAHAFSSTLAEAMEHASRTIGPKDVAAWVKLHYLAGRIVNPRFMADYLTTVEPVALVATSDGAVTAHITGASQNERHLYEWLIDEAQRYFGHRKHPGGRPRTEESTESAELATTVAKLAWMGLSTAQIAAFMGWDSSDADAIEKRVSTYFRAGKAALAESDRLWPNGQSVPVVRPPRRKGLGPPWG